MPNSRLGVRRREREYDAHGMPLPATDFGGPREGPWPGRKTENKDQAGWVLALDPACWPLLPLETLVYDADTGQEWTVEVADLLSHSLVTLIDYVRVEAHIRDASGSTRLNQ